MPRLSLANRDARVVYLATVYHLGRPGSEIDARTLSPHGLGLGPVREAVVPHIEQATVTVELSDYQLSRLGQALLGVINELKQFEMAEGRSAVPGFAASAGDLFPTLRDEPGAALDLARHALMLHRRLRAAIREADAAVARTREEQALREARPRRRWWLPWQWWQWRRR